MVKLSLQYAISPSQFYSHLFISGVIYPEKASSLDFKEAAARDFVILKVGSRHQNEACGNRWTWNKMDAKFIFCIETYGPMPKCKI